MPAAISDAEIQRTIDALCKHRGNQTKAGLELGLAQNTVLMRLNSARRRGLVTREQEASWNPDQPAIVAVGGQTLSVEGNTAEVTKTTHERVRTLHDLIRVCEIDTDEWEVERYVCNKWEMGAKVGKQETAQITVTPLYQVKAWLKRKVVIIAVRAELAALLEDAKRKVTPRPSVKRAKKGSLLFEPSIPDLHAGKHAWAQETGWENYDAKTAVAVFKEALHTLIQRTSGYQFERVLFPIGNDLFHSDTHKGQTTKGTQLDMDSRYHKVFVTVREMMTEAIDDCRAIAPVDVVMVSGNHDMLSVWHLGHSLECVYAKCKDVTINNAPTPRKYYRFGKVMLMFTHGHEGKRSDYPLVMATEQPEMFGATIYREAHTGDKHHQRVEEFKGVKVRISPALCPPDAWHSEKMFVGSQRSAEAFVWDKEDGLIGTAHYTIRRVKDDAA